MKDSAGKFGSLGAIVTAALCPICFPKLALLGAFFGLGALAKYETIFFYASQVFVLVMLVAGIISFKRYKNKALLILVVLSVVLFFTSLYIFASEILSYVALAGLVAASIWSVLESRRCSACEPPAVTSTD
jgi:mercuric ion transport protein